MLLQNVASIIKRGITTLQSISIQMKWHWSFSLGLNWAFLETPPIQRFRRDSIAQNENAVSTVIFRFLINPRRFCKI